MFVAVRRLFNTYLNSRKIKIEYLYQKNRNFGNIHFYNWWHVNNYESLWFYRFVQNMGLLEGTNKQLNFCTVFQNRKVLSHIDDGIKIFFSGENLRLPSWSHYADALLGDKDCQLSLGFDYFEDKRYFRFPLWFTYMFEPTLNEDLIKQRCEQLRYPRIERREKFACMIARADFSGLRTEMYYALSALGNIDCPSELFHNDDSLKNQYNDDKIAYMQRYLFNICPENSNAYGYCTEKVFEAIDAGCIPIYWGSYNVPEPKILNSEAIILWDKESGGTDSICKIRKLLEDSNFITEFINQPRLQPNAEMEILNVMTGLYDKLKILIRE